MDFLSILLGTPDWQILVGTFVLAAMTGRWWVVLLPVTGWSLYFVGLHAGWWGGPPGEFWQFGLALELAAGLAATGIGVLVHGWLWPRRRRKGLS